MPVQEVYASKHTVKKLFLPKRAISLSAENCYLQTNEVINCIIYLHCVWKNNPLTSAWPHLRCHVGLEEGQHCYSIVYYYNGA